MLLKNEKSRRVAECIYRVMQRENGTSIRAREFKRAKDGGRPIKVNSRRFSVIGLSRKKFRGIVWEYIIKTLIRMWVFQIYTTRFKIRRTSLTSRQAGGVWRTLLMWLLWWVDAIWGRHMNRFTVPSWCKLSVIVYTQLFSSYVWYIV